MRGIPALLGFQHLGSCAGSQGSVKVIIPSDLVPGVGCSLGKSREKGYKALAGRVPASRRGAALGEAKALNLYGEKIFSFLMQNLFLIFFSFFLKCQNLQI